MPSLLTLHAAIGAVLVDAGARRGRRVWLTYKQIGDRIADSGLYSRGDGDAPPTNQISARVNKYPDLFETRPGASVEVALREMV